VRMVRYAMHLKRHNYRIVHCFFNDSSVIAPVFIKLLGIRVLVSRRDMGFWYTPAVLTALRLVRPFVDRYIANSKAVKQLVHSREGAPSDKIAVIYNGYPAPPRVEDELGDSQAGELSRYHPLVGIVANLRPIKRIDTLVEAFALVRQNYPRAALVIVGDTCAQQAQATLQHLHELAARLCVDDAVIFTGRVSRAQAYIERFSVAVLCSESEGLSNALIEYMLARRAIVCTDTGGNPELVHDGHNGFLFQIGDSKKLADRVMTLLRDSDLAERFGDAAHASIAAYTVQRMVDAHMACYDEVHRAHSRSSKS
jgi:L-malate glycosyltransferase